MSGGNRETELPNGATAVAPGLVGKMPSHEAPDLNISQYKRRVLEVNTERPIGLVDTKGTAWPA